MLRQRYGLNSQILNWGGFNELIPLGYFETVPGETIQGSCSIKVRSQPTKLAVDTRAYLDVYAFYVPFRVLWGGEFWQNFITKSPSATTVPPVTDLFPFNFETRFTRGSASYNENAPWQRWAYNMVWNQFFRRDEVTQRSKAQTGVAYASQRPSTLESSNMLGANATQDTPVSTAGNTFNLSTLRRAFAADKFNKMRAMYGHRYIDFLASLGVKVPWTILEEPELIGQKHADLRYAEVAQTAPTTAGAPNNVVGQTSGYFKSRIRLSLKRTFSPEHGLVCLYGVTRAEGIFQNPAQPPVICKVNPDQFWTPETEAMTGPVPIPGTGLTDPVFISGAVFGNTDYRWPAFQEYRQGLNYSRAPIPANPQYYLAVDGVLENPVKFQELIQSNYGSNFTQATLQTFQFVNECRLVRHSPVRRIDDRIKLS